MRYLWEDLKMLFEVIATIILINFIFWSIVGQIFVDIYTNDTNNTNEQIVDYDTYIKNTYNQTLTPNTPTVEKDNSDDYTITSDDLQLYKQNSDYIPGKANPFGN